MAKSKTKETTDIVPDLLSEIEKTYKDLISKDEVLLSIRKKIAEGGTYADAQDFAGEIAVCLQKALQTHLSSDVLPDGKMYYNIAKRILDPMLKKAQVEINGVCRDVQEYLNQEAGIGIRGLTVRPNQSRIDGISWKIGQEDFEDVEWLLQAPIENFCRSIVDDTADANANFASKAGLHPIIVRKAEPKCCKWCSGLAGKYPYRADMDREVFRRHENCRCLVEYDPRDGSNRRQDVHSKVWYEEIDESKVLPGESSRADYRNYSYSKDIEKKLKSGVEIKVRRILNTDNVIYADVNSCLSKKEISKVDQALTTARKKLGVTSESGPVPEHIIYSDRTLGQIGGPTASYLPKTNQMFINDSFLYSEAMSERSKQEGYVYPDKYVSTFTHEYSHWKRTQEWLRETKDLSVKPTIHEFSKSILDIMGLKEKEMIRVSQYSERSLKNGLYFEVLAEVDTKDALK